MAELVGHIRTEYPNPLKAAASCVTGAYCVGGALCQFIGLHQSFPMKEELQHVLRDEVGLSNGESYRYARRIISRNDMGKFDEAWAVLEEALNTNPSAPLTVLDKHNDKKACKVGG